MKGHQVDMAQGCHSLRNNGQWPPLDNRKSDYDFFIFIFPIFFTVIDNHFYSKRKKTTS